MTQWRRAMFFRHGQDLHIFSPFIFIHRGYISQFSIWVSKEKVTLALLVDISNSNSGGWENSQICVNPLLNYIWFLRDVQCWVFNVGGKGLFPCWIIVLLHIPSISSWWLGKLPFLCRIPRNRTNVSSENQGIPSNTPRNPIFFGWIDPPGFGKICASERRKPNHGFFLEVLIIKKWRCPSSIFPSNSVSGESPPFFVDRQIQHCRFHSSTWSKMQWGVFVC